MNVLRNQNCALLLIDMFITANISSDFSDCLHSNCISANQLCAIELRKQHSGSLYVSFALPLQNSSCAYLSKHFRWENGKSARIGRRKTAKANAFAFDERRSKCVKYSGRRKNRTVYSAGKYGTRKTAAAASNIYCVWMEN